MNLFLNIFAENGVDDFTNKTKNALNGVWKVATPLIIAATVILGIALAIAFVWTLFKYHGADTAQERKAFMVKMVWILLILILSAASTSIITLVIAPITGGKESNTAILISNKHFFDTIINFV